MQDFAYLFSDSVAAWLRGRGDFRFKRYERHYRAGRSAAQDAGSFDLERSNEQYAATYRRKGSYLAVVVESKAFKRLVPFLIMLWGGSLLLPAIGESQPVAAGVVLLGIFVALRIKGRKGSARGRQQTVAR